ncbi:hypothetical protein [Sphingomonas radiodurans]|uniref:hypothetical protein n=1 Tax=Sphingomonas radiodurans TaxID=2890321 RepID=UPI001E2D7298|nr:hypothetical protein [Sphingomonas radiodurans]WBH18071.1 hypothetical protein LLW23_08265 [Sphingomonas radiodurans]
MRHWIMLSAATLALAACSEQPENTAPADTAEANTTDTTPEGPSLTARLFGGGKPIALAQQKVLENGMVVNLTSFQAKADESVLGVRIVNGADKDVDLDWSNHKTFLVANGQKFWLSPPVENKDLKVTQGAKMEGELVFLGAIPKGATVTLVVNDGMSDSQYSSTPGFSLPLEATEAAWSDDGSKKNLAARVSPVTSRDRGYAPQAALPAA